MPKRIPQSTGGLVFHVLNRGVRRMQLFDQPVDYDAFVDLFELAQRRTPIRCLAYCLMPNHFHFVLWPSAEGELSRFMFWLSTVHAKRWHLAHGSIGNGHVYQGRFKALPVCADGHFLRVCRYVERNPLRAGLVERAEDWAWSSLAQRVRRPRGLILGDWPVDRPSGWTDVVNETGIGDEFEIRRAIKDSRPFGPALWSAGVAGEPRIPSRPRGRPKK